MAQAANENSTGGVIKALLLAAGIITILATLGAACGGGGSDEEETPSPSPSPSATPRETVSPAEFEAAATDLAKGAVLLLDDMPSGWTSDPASEEGEDLALSEDCNVLNGDIPAVAYATSEDFTGPYAQSAGSEVYVFDTETAAEESLDMFNQAMARCRGELTVAVEQLFREGYQEAGGDPATLTDLTVSVPALSFAKVGDASNAYRMELAGTAEEQAFVYALDFVFIRSGRVVGTFYYNSDYPDVEEEERIARTFANKMTSTDLNLPD